MCLVAVVAASATTTAHAESASWLQIETPGVRIVTNGARTQAEDIAHQLDVYRSVVGEFFPSWRFESPSPVTLFVVDRRTWRDAVAPAASVPGFTTSLPSGPVIALNGDGWGDAHNDVRQAALHEITHHYLNLNRHGNRFPVWYEEGLAEFLSTARIWWSLTGSEIELGLAPQNRLRTFAAGRWMPLRRVFAATRDSPEYQDPDLASAFYAESWALVHYAFIGNPTWTEAMGRYLSAHASGRSAAEAVALALPGDHGDFEKALFAYVMADRIPLVRRKVPKMSQSTLQSSPISDAEGRLELGRLLVERRPDRASTRAFLEESVRRAGPLSSSTVLLASLLAMRGDWAAARQIAGPACDSASASAQLLALCGDVERSHAAALIVDGRNSDTADEIVRGARAARDQYERARQGGDGTLATLMSYAATQVIAPGGDAAVRGLLESSLRDMPGNGFLAVQVAESWAAENPQHSVEVLRQALRDADSEYSASRILQCLRAILPALSR